MKPSLVASLLISAIAVADCGSLPYFLTVHRDRIVAVDVALRPQTPGADDARVTLVRDFVRASDLHHLAAAVAGVMSMTRLEDVSVRLVPGSPSNAHVPAGAAAIEASPDLRRLQERMVEATRAFSTDAAAAKDFISTPDGSRMSGDTIRAVATYVPERSGVNFQPFVATSSTPGQPPQSSDSFKAAGAAVYQLDRSGNAERVLWVWTGESGAKEP